MNTATTDTRAIAMVVVLLVISDGGDNCVVKPIDEIGFHIRWQLIDCFERVVQTIMHCVERGHALIVGVADLVVTTTEFRSICTASVFCTRDVCELAGEITLPLLVQSFIFMIFVGGVSPVSGINVNDNASALGDRVGGVKFCLETYLEGSLLPSYKLTISDKFIRTDWTLDSGLIDKPGTYYSWAIYLLSIHHKTPTSVVDQKL
ncbi:hypothetical protein DMJ13_20205 [halophilic archaeon]|nr:hypothetical protein DMJ13_20205 [halophilic archaeon]